MLSERMKCEMCYPDYYCLFIKGAEFTCPLSEAIKKERDRQQYMMELVRKKIS